MNAWKKTLEAIAIPLILLNMFGGTIAGIWLAILGEWKLLLIGIGLIFTSYWFLAILLLPGLLVLPIAAYLFRTRSPLRYVVAFLPHLYTNLLIAGTCALAFKFCLSFFHGTSMIGITPYLLWSWGMAMGPWEFLAHKEQNENSAIMVFSASIFYLLFLISVFLGPIAIIIVVSLFVLVQLILLPACLIYLTAKIKEATF